MKGGDGVKADRDPLLDGVGEGIVNPEHNGDSHVDDKGVPITDDHLA